MIEVKHLIKKRCQKCLNVVFVEEKKCSRCGSKSFASVFSGFKVIKTRDSFGDKKKKRVKTSTAF